MLQLLGAAVFMFEKRCGTEKRGLLLFLMAMARWQKADVVCVCSRFVVSSGSVVGGEFVEGNSMSLS